MQESMDKKSHPVLNLVIEIGSSFIRGGYAGEPHPHVIVKNKYFSSLESDSNVLSSDILMGLRNLFIDVLQVKSKDAHVLIIEHIYNRSALREALYRALLNGMQVRAVSFQPDLCMPILATGHSCGLVVDIGSRESRALAIAYGRPILSSFQALPVGTGHCIEILQKRLSALWSENSASCNMSDLFTQAACHEEAVDLLLPDGKIVPGDLRKQCLDPLICGRHEELWDAVGGCAGMILECLLQCDVHLRKQLAERIIVTGGGSCISGVAEGICTTANSMVKEDERYQSVGAMTIALHEAPFVRSNFTWMGGSVFASIKSNREKFYVYASDLPLGAKMPDWLSTNPVDWKFFRPRVDPIDI